LYRNSIDIKANSNSDNNVILNDLVLNKAFW